MSNKDPLNDAVVKNIIDSMQTQTNTIFDDLVVKNENSKLPEEIFQGHFLPFFSGQRHASKDDNVIAEWISVAGTPMNEVDIIDRDGEVLFTVPPLMDTNIINVTTNTSQRSMSAILSNYDLHHNNIPKVAVNKLNQNLGDKSEALLNPKVSFENKERWDKIMLRYNISPEEVATKTSEIDTNDDVNYDEGD